MQIPYEVQARPDTGLYNAKLGIWLFLASEVMLFGGLFSAYIFLRIGADVGYWPKGLLNVPIGTFNTIILILSSVTVIRAWMSLKMRRYADYKKWMGITILCGAAFLIIKLTLEWPPKFGHFGAIIKKDKQEEYEKYLGNEHMRARGLPERNEISGHLEAVEFTFDGGDIEDVRTYANRKGCEISDAPHDAHAWAEAPAAGEHAAAPGGAAAAPTAAPANAPQQTATAAKPSSDPATPPAEIAAAAAAPAAPAQTVDANAPAAPAPVPAAAGPGAPSPNPGGAPAAPAAAPAAHPAKLYVMKAKHEEEGFWPSVAEGLQRVKGVKLVSFEVKPDPINENPADPENDKPHFIPKTPNHHAAPVKIEAADVHHWSAFVPKHSTYFATYFMITGLHGAHVLGGVLVFCFLWGPGARLYRKNPEHLANRVEVAGLFWHFVDLIWIFVFPLFYLL